MFKREWVVKLDDVEHVVEFTCRGLAYNKEIRVDGEKLDLQFERTPLAKLTGSEDTFEYGNHRITVYIKPRIIKVDLELVVDGISEETGQPVAPWRPLPRWVWVFIILCIPMLVGGLLPVFIGLFTVKNCCKIARSARSQAVRIGGCLGLTACAWGTVIMFVWLRLVLR